jgi:hypothetical protein
MFSLHLGANAQEQPPDLLLHAAQCLSTKKFLASTNDTVLNFGYLLDFKSYPGKKLMYVVRYTRSDRSTGEAFALFLSQSHRQRVLSIWNNATFVRTENGVEFTGDPLGGIWIQEHLVSAIKRIGQKPRFEIPIKNLRPSRQIKCEAYTDR